MYVYDAFTRSLTQCCILPVSSGSLSSRYRARRNWEKKFSQCRVPVGTYTLHLSTIWENYPGVIDDIKSRGENILTCPANLFGIFCNQGSTVCCRCQTFLCDPSKLQDGGCHLGSQTFVFLAKTSRRTNKNVISPFECLSINFDAL